MKIFKNFTVCFITIAILFILESCLYTDKPEEIRDSYLPLVEGAKYTYKGVFKGSTYMPEYTLNAIRLDNGFFLHYFKAKGNKTHSDLFGTVEGMYRYSDGNLMGISPEGAITSSWSLNRLRATSIKYEYLILPENPVIGYSNTIFRRDTANKRIYAVIGFEDVEVPAGVFEDCLKLEITTNWFKYGKSTYVDSIWLKKGVGVVKRVYGTGRIDELNNYHIPGMLSTEN